MTIWANPADVSIHSECQRTLYSNRVYTVRHNREGESLSQLRSIVRIWFIKMFSFDFLTPQVFREWKTNRILNNSHFFFFFSSWGRHLLAIMSLWGITYWGFSVFFPVFNSQFVLLLFHHFILICLRARPINAKSFGHIDVMGVKKHICVSLIFGALLRNDQNLIGMIAYFRVLYIWCTWVSFWKLL